MNVFMRINYNLANSESFQVMATCALNTFMGFGEQLIIGLNGTYLYRKNGKEAREKQMSEQELDHLADDRRESEEEEEEEDEEALDKNDD